MLVSGGLFSFVLNKSLMMAPRCRNMWEFYTWAWIILLSSYVFFVVKGPAANATDAPQPWSLLCNPVMKMISFFFLLVWSTGGMKLTGENLSIRGKNLSQCYFVHHKSHVDWKCLCFFFNGSTAPWGPRPPQFFRLHDHTLDTPHSVGFLWTTDQPVAETSTWQHTTLTRYRHPYPRWDTNPQSQ
jgi:hypothetical protein